MQRVPKRRVLNVMVIDSNYKKWKDKQRENTVRSLLARAQQEGIKIIIILGNKGDSSAQMLLEFVEAKKAEDGIFVMPLDRGSIGKDYMNKVASFLLDSDFTVGKLVLFSDKDLLAWGLRSMSEIAENLAQEVIGVGFANESQAAA